MFNRPQIKTAEQVRTKGSSKGTLLRSSMEKIAIKCEIHRVVSTFYSFSDRRCLWNCLCEAIDALRLGKCRLLKFSNVSALTHRINTPFLSTRIINFKFHFDIFSRLQKRDTLTNYAFMMEVRKGMSQRRSNDAARFLAVVVQRSNASITFNMELASIVLAVTRRNVSPLQTVFNNLNIKEFRNYLRTWVEALNYLAGNIL